MEILKFIAVLTVIVVEAANSFPKRKGRTKKPLSPPPWPMPPSQSPQHSPTSSSSSELSPPLNPSSLAPLPSLLGLPGELRNKIYGHVLLSDDTIKILEENFSEPQLLAVCRQIRTDASQIYFCENKFTVDVPDWDPTNLIALYERLRRLEDENGKTPKFQGAYQNFPGSMTNKKNLLKYLKARHQGKIRAITYRDHGEAVMTAASGACEIGRCMEERPWSEVERVLEIYLAEVCKNNGRGWYWD